MSKMTKQKMKKQEILTKLQSKIESMNYSARLFGRDWIGVTSNTSNAITRTLLEVVSKEVPEIKLVSIMSNGIGVTAFFSPIE